MNESVKTGLWVGDCFIYTNSVNRINYYVGGETVTIAHLDHTMYLLGYVPKENRSDIQRLFAHRFLCALKPSLFLLGITE